MTKRTFTPNLRQTIAAAATLTLCFYAQAQKIEWGPRLTMKKSYNAVILGEDKDNFYTTSIINGGMFKDPHLDVEKFDKGSKQRAYVQSLDLKMNGDSKFKPSLEKIAYTGDHFITFHSYFDKKAKEMVIYANAYSVATGKAIKREEKILTVPVEKKRPGDFTVLVSESGKRLLVSHIAYYKKQDKTRERLILLDENLKTLVEREDASQGARYSKTVAGLGLDDDGSFYFNKVVGDRRVIVAYDAARDYEKWEETIDHQKIGLPVAGEIFNVSAVLTRKKDLVIVGYYTKDGKQLDGTYGLKIDGKSKELVVQKLNDFDQSFKDQFKTKRDIKKNRDGKIKYFFGPMTLYKKDDGGVVGVSEMFQHYIKRDRNGFPDAERYIFGDMIAVSMENDGTLQWAQRLKKSQQYNYNRIGPLIFTSTGLKLFHQSFKPLDYMSYFAAIGKNKFYVAFNDNAKNLQKKSDQDKLRPFKKPTEAVMSIYTIDLATGEKKRSAFFGGKDFSVTVEPNTVYQRTQSSPPIILGSNKREFKYGLMLLD
jgi:outer membrane protein assembly factor BamB